jgi:hypothetical protein
MFRYKPVDMSGQSFYSSTHTLEVATLEELIELCKKKEVDRVIIPQTYDLEGYGADLISLSNSRSIKRDYKNRVKAYGHELSISAWQFLRHEEFQEMIEALAEYGEPYDSDDYSQLESERHEDFIVDELYFALQDDSRFEAWDRENVRSVLHSGGWERIDPNDKYSPVRDTRLEWWEIVTTDNDGLTPYMKDEDFDAFLEEFKDRAIELGKIK